MWILERIKTKRGAVRNKGWSKLRRKHLKKHPECAACGRTKKLEVHHIIPVHVNKALEMEETNLITLCAKNCHLFIGHLKDFKSYNKDVKKDAIQYRNKHEKRPITEKEEETETVFITKKRRI